MPRTSSRMPRLSVKQIQAANVVVINSYIKQRVAREWASGRHRCILATQVNLDLSIRLNVEIQHKSVACRFVKMDARPRIGILKPSAKTVMPQRGDFNTGYGRLYCG